MPDRGILTVLLPSSLKQFSTRVADVPEVPDFDVRFKEAVQDFATGHLGRHADQVGETGVLHLDDAQRFELLQEPGLVRRRGELIGALLPFPVELIEGT